MSGWTASPRELERRRVRRALRRRRVLAASVATVVVIGGLGSFWGVVLAAMLVGVVRGITIHFAPAAGEASIYVLMFLVLLVRPRGLLGERIEKFE